MMSLSQPMILANQHELAFAKNQFTDHNKGSEFKTKLGNNRIIWLALLWIL
jgi:hypothetical protein